jgi:hypothetical protein
MRKMLEDSWQENRNERGHLQDMDVDGKAVLKSFLNK